tara:strand:+ start:8158 stop:8514 length:357 start_codon:yes stop_codon:yes gene_type:complete
MTEKNSTGTKPAAKKKAADTPKKTTRAKRSFGEIIIMETLDTDVSAGGDGDAVPATALVPSPRFRGCSFKDTGDAERAIREVVLGDADEDGFEFVIIRKVKTLRVRPKVVRTVVVEES